MSDFKTEDRKEEEILNHLAEVKDPSEMETYPMPNENLRVKVIPTNPRRLDFKTRMAMLKAKGSKLPSSIPEAPVHSKKDEKPVIVAERPDLAPGIEIVPGDPSKPQNEVERLVEADRQFAKNVVEKSGVEDVQRDSERVLNAEALFDEIVNDKLADRERFKLVFINTIQQDCAGKSLDEIEASIRRDHEMLFDTRTGIQAKLAYRSELLKDATAEERAKRLKDDWLFKPSKKVAAPTKAKSTSDEPKAPKTKKTKFDAMAEIRKSLTEAVREKNPDLSDEEIKAKVDKKLAKLGAA